MCLSPKSISAGLKIWWIKIIKCVEDNICVHFWTMRKISYIAKNKWQSLYIEIKNFCLTKTTQIKRQNFVNGEDTGNTYNWQDWFLNI